MSLYGNYYPESADLSLAKQYHIEQHYQALQEEYEDKVREEYFPLTLVLKNGKVLMGDSLGEVLCNEASKKDLDKLTPLINDIYKGNADEFNQYDVHNGEELKNFIYNNNLDSYKYEFFIDDINESLPEDDIYSYDKLFTDIWDLDNEDDVKDLAERMYEGE
jgi:hypothetical protein